MSHYINKLTVVYIVYMNIFFRTIYLNNYLCKFAALLTVVSLMSMEMPCTISTEIPVVHSL
jgi:hypothetical protein